MIYEPAEDSLLLKKFIKKYASGRVLDMGTGSGILALEAMKYSKHVEACDINKDAVEFAKSKGVRSYVSDLFSNVSGKFDLIIFNPPYLPEDKYDKEKDTTGGKKGNETLIRFFKDARRFLNKNGKILIVASSLTPDAEKIIISNKFKFKILGEEKMFFEVLKAYLCY